MKINKNHLMELLFIFIIAIIGKVYQFTVLNGNAFGIISRIIASLNLSTFPSDLSYLLPLRFYRLFKFLPFKTPLEWAIFWTVVMNIIFFIFLLKNKEKYKMQELIFIYASMFILDVFVFNINKDLVQCLIVLLIFMLTRFVKNDRLKLLIAVLVMFWESTCFRSYYILCSLTLLIVFFTLSKFILNKGINKISILKSIFFILIFLFISIYFVQFIDNKAYNQLLGRRDTLAEDLPDVNTVIVDLIPGQGFNNYCINYIINLFRLSFPIELLFMGLKYFPFALYQIYLTINIIKNINNINKKNIFNISFIVGYWLMLFASESDFGTLVRHQAILFPFYLQMIDENIKSKGMCKNEKN